MRFYTRMTVVSSAIAFGLVANGCKFVSANRAGDSYPVAKPAFANTAISPQRVAETFIFIVNGGDPFHFAEVEGLAKQFYQGGYQNTLVVEWHQSETLEREIRKAHQTDPYARFVLIGYSIGAYTVRTTASRMIRDGVPVALVGYIGGDYLQDNAETRLVGAGRVVNITGDGHMLTGRNLLFNGTEITGARNVRLNGIRHFNLPRHPQTFATLLEELNFVIASGW